MKGLAVRVSGEGFRVVFCLVGVFGGCFARVL